ncbi:MAG: hypothetical protein U9P14_06900 [Gemmatimonadota bacterium]|nr:hypothetical protein [Gemmatimonadota bacterium]
MTDHRTAAILADRMVESFFGGLSKAERVELAVGEAIKGGSLPPGLSMLACTLDVFLESVSLPEDQGRELFKEAVRKKMQQIREELSTGGGGKDQGKAK